VFVRVGVQQRRWSCWSCQDASEGLGRAQKYAIFIAGTPVLFTKKKDRSLHLCVNLQGLNTITKRDHYPLLLILNLLNCLCNSSVFTKINL
jgi:hypothetical protein